MAIAFRRTVSGPGGCPRHPRRLVVLLLAGGVSLVVSTGIASAATIVIPAGATQISADWSGYGGCAVVDAGAVECWGDNEEGQLGNGSTSPSATPVRVAGLSGAQMVSVGGHHACALLAGGTLRCWGRDMDGELGNGVVAPEGTSPVAVSGIADATSVSAGERRSCAVLADGSARCWGWNAWGLLGDGTEETSAVPVGVVGLAHAARVSVGNKQTCALLESGSVDCWGVNGYEGGLGYGLETFSSPSPVSVSGIETATGLSSTNYSCTPMFDGTVRCWGWNTYGTLGNGTMERTLKPVAVSGLDGVREVSVGLQHACALRLDGTVWCWGQNYGGQLGDGVGPGGEAEPSTVPVRSYMSGALQISSGEESTCVVLPGGAVECWGAGYGPLEAPAGPPGPGAPPPGPGGSGGGDAGIGTGAPPAVRIIAHPPRETADQSARFEFTGTAGGAYECSIDGAPWRACRSGDSFGPLQPGDHRFEVREVLNGQTSDPASYSWTVDLPRACVIKVARARVFAFTHRDKARLVIHYKAYEPARVIVSYSSTGTYGALRLGTASSQFQTAGVFRLGEKLTRRSAAKLAATRSMTVKFTIPQAPSSCTRYYTKRLTIPKKVFGQTVWFQSDSIFGPEGS